MGLALALVLSLWIAATDDADIASSQASIDVSVDAVQTFYQNGVPHTDWTGSATTTFQQGSSFFPIGMYFPTACKTQETFTWPAFIDESHPLWQDFKAEGQTYSLFINVGTSPEFFFPGNRVLLHGSHDHTGTSAIVDGLPAGADLYFTVLPNPWPTFLSSDPPLAEGTFQLSCPPDDPDLPNVVQTLADGGFNLGIIKTPDHPQPYVDLKNSAGAPDFEFVIDARVGVCFYGFPQQLFDPAEVDDGQGYSQNPDIYGWQLEDEPLLRAATGPPAACNPAPDCDLRLPDALDRLTGKYDSHKDLTDQVLFLVEGSPTYFPTACDPGQLWEDSVRIGDAANHDHYINPNQQGVPLDSLQPIADSVARQTNALNGLEPSWFTVQAYSAGDNGFRTPEETRATAYTAIVHGATGIWYFMMDNDIARSVDLVGIRPTIPASYGSGGFVPSLATRQQAEEAWAGITTLNAELASLEDVILSPTASVLYQVFVSRQTNSWSPIRTTLKEVDGQDYLIAVNMDNVATTAEFHFADPITAASELFDPSPQHTVVGNVLGDTFDAFEVHVYQLEFQDSDSVAIPDSADN